jgi:hypothetical protein
MAGQPLNMNIAPRFSQLVPRKAAGWQLQILLQAAASSCLLCALLLLLLVVVVVVVVVVLLVVVVVVLLLPPPPTPSSRPHLGVFDKPLQAVHKVGAVEGVAADAHHRGLAQALLAGLEHSLGGV